MHRDPVEILQQEHFRVLIDHASQPMLILDVESGKFIDFNHKAEKFFKLSGPQLRSLGPADLSPELIDGQDVTLYSRQLIQKALDGGSSIFPWVHINSEGKEICCDIYLVRFPPYERKLVSATIIDKTQKREMEQALAKNEDRLKLALEVTSLGYFDWAYASGSIHWDDKMYELHGLSPEAEVDKIQHIFTILHPDDREWMKTRLQQAMQPNGNLTVFDGNHPTFERAYRILINGQIRYIQANGSFFRNEEGDIQRVIGTVRDITIKKQAEEQLRYQAALLDNVSDAVISTDIHFVIKSWNAAAEKLYRWKADEMIGRSIYDIPFEYPNNAAGEVQAEFQRNGCWKGEVIQKNKEGQDVYVLTSVVTFRDQLGKPLGYITVNRDIAQEKEAEIQRLRARQLELKNKELEQFAYAVSHDLQEPLHTVKGFVQLLRNHIREGLDERSIEYMELISQSIHRMNNLIRALLEYSRVGLQEEIVKVDTGVLVRELMNDLSAQISASDAQIHFEALPQLPGYETELRVLFQNLISNAIKFRKLKVPPEISISARENRNAWEFCIMDNGIGISPKHRHRIFAIFQRLHPHGDYPGTGIGLSICAKIIELHGGKIWVESIPETGSKFFFTLPK